MEQFISMIEWGPVLVSFVLAYGLGWVWYADIGFGKRWRVGKGGAVVEHPMWMPISAQAGATLLFAIIVNLATADGHVGHAVLVGLTIAGFIKTNGLFGGRTIYAITVDTVYVLAMLAIMVGVNMWL